MWNRGSPGAAEHLLVLGAAGFIGRWVARAASAAGLRCTLAVRDASAAREIFERYDARGDIVGCDLSDPREVTRLVENVPSTIICNLAGYGVDARERDEALAQRINADLPETLMGACAALRSRSAPVIVHVGSALEYGTTGGELAEDSPERPGTTYGRTKLAGTDAVRRLAPALGVRAVTARLFTVYGPGEPAGRLLPTLVDRARTSADIPLTDGLQRRDFAYVEDVAGALLELARSASEPGEVVNLATGTLTRVREFVQRAAALLGIPGERLRFGALPWRAEEMRHDGVRVDRLRALIGQAPSADLTSGLRRTIDFIADPARR